MKFLKQSDYCWAGLKGISRTNAWYDFKKKNPHTRIYIDVFNDGELVHKNVQLSSVSVDHSKVWVKNEKGGHNLEEIPNNSEWEMTLRATKTFYPKFVPVENNGKAYMARTKPISV